jgi:nitrous oxidase accessory protein NosD
MLMTKLPSLRVAVSALVVTLFAMSIELPSSAAASRIAVPADFPTIQAAIDAANPGATITVSGGTYIEQLTINKDVTIIGAGVESTVIAAPAVLNPRKVNPRPRRAVIIEIYGGADVQMSNLTVLGPSGDTCLTVTPPGGLAGFSVQEDATLTLDSSAIKGCTREGLLIGFSPSIPGGPNVGHATITRSQITQYQGVGIQAGGPGTTLTIAHSALVAAANSAFDGQVGIGADTGVTAVIEHNRLSGNLCNIDPSCGPDPLTEVQAVGIFAIEAGDGSVISHNEVFGNDVGIAVIGGSGCCDVNHNELTNNRFFGMIVVDGNHTSSHDKISGGNVGVAVIATAVDTVGTLVHDKIDTSIPVQELSCCGLSAHAVVIH